MRESALAAWGVSKVVLLVLSTWLLRRLTRLHCHSRLMYQTWICSVTGTYCGTAISRSGSTTTASTPGNLATRRSAPSLSA